MTETMTAPPRPSRLVRRVAEETMHGAVVSPRFLLANLFLSLLPDGAFGSLRAAVYRSVWGIPIGRSTVIIGRIAWGSPHLAARNVRVGERCIINARAFVDAAAPISIGDNVSLAHDTLLITTDHVIGTSDFRAAERIPKPVSIGRGAWIAAGATVLPGRTVGAGAVVAAGAVVTKDVAPDTLVAGTPARKVRDL